MPCRFEGEDANLGRLSFENARMRHSNLGGIGPDVDVPKSIRIDNVGLSRGREPLSLESLTGSPEELADAIEEATALLLDSRAIKQQSMELRWHELLLSSHSYANISN